MDWMDYRASYGERITPDSWAMRDFWKTTNITYGAKLGYAKTPVKLKSSGIRSLLSKALFQQNVKPVLKNGSKRHEFKTAHGFKKYTKKTVILLLLSVLIILPSFNKNITIFWICFNIITYIQKRRGRYFYLQLQCFKYK